MALASYLGSIPDGAAKLDGIKLDEAVAARILAARENDGCYEPDDYRPRTTPGVYVATPIKRTVQLPRYVKVPSPAAVADLPDPAPVGDGGNPRLPVEDASPQLPSLAGQRPQCGRN